MGNQVPRISPTVKETPFCRLFLSTQALLLNPDTPDQEEMAQTGDLPMTYSIRFIRTNRTKLFRSLSILSGLIRIFATVRHFMIRYQIDASQGMIAKTDCVASIDEERMYQLETSEELFSCRRKDWFILIKQTSSNTHLVPREETLGNV